MLSGRDKTRLFNTLHSITESDTGMKQYSNPKLSNIKAPHMYIATKFCNPIVHITDMLNK